MKDRSILLVDDEEIILKSLASMLMAEGYKVTAAESGEKALELFKKNHFPFVITDLRMNEMDGIEFLEQVKKLKPETMVMIITGFGGMETAIKGLQLGACDYILKPCKNAELLHRVETGFQRLDLQLKVKAYEKLVLVCCVCGKIMDEIRKEEDKEEWISFEDFLERHSDLKASHGYCPDCYKTAVKQTAEEVKEYKKNK